MGTEFLAAERAGAIRPGFPDGLLVSEDLLSFFVVVLLLRIKCTGPLVDLRKPETDCQFRAGPPRSPVPPQDRPATLAMNSAFFSASASSPLIRARCFSARAARSAISRVANPSSAVRRRYSAFFSCSPSSRCRIIGVRTRGLLDTVVLGLLSASRASEASSFFACAVSASRSCSRVCCCWRRRAYAVFFSASSFR